MRKALWMLESILELESELIIAACRKLPCEAEALNFVTSKCNVDL